MGIYDRDYQRSYDTGSNWRPEGGGGPGIQLRKPTTVVGWVLVITIAAYVVELIFEPRGLNGVNEFLALFRLEADWYSRPWEVFTLLTYGFLHSPDSVMHIFGNMFGFWMFGRMIESRLGSREFLLFYLLAIVMGGVVFSLGAAASGSLAPVIGASAGSVAVVLLCAVMYPHQKVSLLFLPFQFPLWVLGAFIVLMDLNGAMGGRQGSNIAFTAHLGGTAFALLYHYRGWRLSRWVPSEWSMPSFKRKPKLRVHSAEMDDAADEPPGSFDEDVNRVLAKISEQGQDSLTSKERRLLEQASQEYKRRGP